MFLIPAYIIHLFDNFRLLHKFVVKQIMLKQNRTIIHLEVKDTHEHIYFGSAAAMFEDSRIKNLLGITYQTFRKKRISEQVTYENDYVIVRKGNLNTILHVSHQYRTRRK